MHPLTILAVGLYGETLPNQNGAPIRLVVPWKYGFKSIKSIVRISLVDKQPPTSWTCRTRASTASIPTSTRRSTIRAGARRRSGASAGRRPVRQAPADAAVQRLRRAGGEPLHRHGPEEEFLRMGAGARSGRIGSMRYSGPIRRGARSMWSAWCRRSRISSSASTISSAPIRRTAGADARPLGAALPDRGLASRRCASSPAPT